MPDAILNRSLESQIVASLETLRHCVESCPEGEWQQRHGDYPFSQVVFHALFYCDFYLSVNEAEFRAQAYHRENPEFFLDYEELEYREARHLYEKSDIQRYLDFCRKKIGATIEPLGLEALLEPSVLGKPGMSRLELFVDLARHIQHHAAQLGLRLQLLTGREMPYLSRDPEITRGK